MNIEQHNKNILTWEGVVSGYVKDADGNRIEGSDFEVRNTVADAFLNRVAARLGGDLTKDINFLVGTPVAQGTFDTIALDIQNSYNIYGCQAISKSQGGDGSVAWIEFRGEYTAGSAQTITGAKLAKSYNSYAGAIEGEVWATASFTKTLQAGQIAVIFWRITFAAA